MLTLHEHEKRLARLSAKQIAKNILELIGPQESIDAFLNIVAQTREMMLLNYLDTFADKNGSKPLDLLEERTTPEKVTLIGEWQVFSDLLKDYAISFKKDFQKPFNTKTPHITVTPPNLAPKGTSSVPIIPTDGNDTDADLRETLKMIWQESLSHRNLNMLHSHGIQQDLGKLKAKVTDKNILELNGPTKHLLMHLYVFLKQQKKPLIEIPMKV